MAAPLSTYLEADVIQTASCDLQNPSDTITLQINLSILTTKVVYTTSIEEGGRRGGAGGGGGVQKLGILK